MLETSRRDLLSRIASLSDQAFHFKPAADLWSIAEILEHLLLTEGFFQGHIEKAMASGANPAWARETAGQDDRLFRFVPLRNRRFDAPAAATPEGKMDRRDLLRRYEEARNKTLAVAKSDAPIKAHTASNGLLGPMNVHQWALFTALHNLRHNQQIVEVMATAEFPHG